MEQLNVKLAKNITEILTEFDFETTVKILKLMDIKWTRDNESRYPTLTDVKETAEELLWEVIEKAYENVANFYYVECGCFRAEYNFIEESKEEYVELLFIPCSWRKIA